MLNITKHQGNTNQNRTRYLLTCIRMATIKKTRNNKYWQGYGKKAILVHCSWKCKLVWKLWEYRIQSVSSVAQSCPTVCDPMNRSTPGLPVHHQLPEFTQTHVHRVSDAIQPSHPLSSPFPPAPNPSQHQNLFQ